MKKFFGSMFAAGFVAGAFAGLAAPTAQAGMFAGDAGRTAVWVYVRAYEDEDIWEPAAGFISAMYIRCAAPGAVRQDAILMRAVLATRAAGPPETAATDTHALHTRRRSIRSTGVAIRRLVSTRSRRGGTLNAVE